MHGLYIGMITPYRRWSRTVSADMTVNRKNGKDNNALDPGEAFISGDMRH